MFYLVKSGTSSKASSEFKVIGYCFRRLLKWLTESTFVMFEGKAFQTFADAYENIKAGQLDATILSSRTS